MDQKDTRLWLIVFEVIGVYQRSSAAEQSLEL